MYLGLTPLSICLSFSYIVQPSSTSSSSYFFFSELSAGEVCDWEHAAGVFLLFVLLRESESMLSPKSVSLAATYIRSNNAAGESKAGRTSKYIEMGALGPALPLFFSLPL